MARLSKKEIKERIEKLKEPTGENHTPTDNQGAPQKLSGKKSSIRIRKQGV